MDTEEHISKSYKRNPIRWIIEHFLAILIGTILLYSLVYFNVIPTNTLRGLIYLLVMIAVCVVGLFNGIFRGISKIEFDKNILRIIHSFNREKTIDFLDIKDFSFGNNYKGVDLYYIDNLKSEKIVLAYFSRNDRKKIVENISEIMSNKFMNYTEEQLEELYGDKK